MPLYTYECVCGLRFEDELPMDDRYNTWCPSCKLGGEKNLVIILHAVPGKMVQGPRLINEAQLRSERGNHWRETPGSLRIKRGEPERIYGLPEKKT
jgi:putative FmdB family regulatory protein